MVSVCGLKPTASSLPVSCSHSISSCCGHTHTHARTLLVRLLFGCTVCIVFGFLLAAIGHHRQSPRLKSARHRFVRSLCVCLRVCVCVCAPACVCACVSCPFSPTLLPRPPSPCAYGASCDRLWCIANSSSHCKAAVWMALLAKRSPVLQKQTQDTRMYLYLRVHVCFNA